MASVSSHYRTPPLGTRTATFLLTDVEGSTALWQQRPDEMLAAIQAHDELLAGCIEAVGGHVLTERGEGDSFFAVFADPASALSAAIAIQERLAAPVASGIRLRVRAAVHTGPAGDDYRGPGVNRCARLRAVAHGGQVLVSSAAVGGLKDRLLGGASLIDLGLNRLRDIAELEHVYQLAHHGLEREFPPLASAANRHNLGPPRTDLIPRDGILDDITARLRAGCRALTLVGPGGIGKSTLAFEAGRQLVDEFTAGVWAVELAPVAEPQLVAVAIAHALGLVDHPTRTAQELVIDHLRDRPTLLVLDNCEHLIEEVAGLAASLLESCKGVALLTTSQEALRIPSELTWTVPPMTLPEARGKGQAEHTSDSEAVALFAARAAAAGGFELTDANAGAVIDICRRLDGIPLAIELAAARCGSLTPEQLVGRLDDRFRLLTGGSRSVPRQRTLEAAIDWSHQLLSRREQVLFRRLACFSGTFTLEAAEAVAQSAPLAKPDVAELIDGLVSRSLLLFVPSPTARYRLLETIRAFALERLRGSGEEKLLRDQHAASFLELAEVAAVKLRGAQQAEWMQLLEREEDNLRAALAWARDAPDPEVGLRLATALYWFWRNRSRTTEGREWLEAAIAAWPEAPPGRRGRAQLGLACLLTNFSDFEPAEVACHESIRLFREAGDEAGLAEALPELAIPLRLRGELVAAERCCEEAVVLARRIDDPRGLAQALFQLVILARLHGQWGRAAELCSDAIAVLGTLGDWQRIADLVLDLALIARASGDFDQADAHAGEALRQFVELGDTQGEANSLGIASWIARCRADLKASRRLADSSLQIWLERGDRYGAAQTRWQLGLTMVRQGEVGAGAAELRTALAEMHRVGDPLSIARLLEALAEVALLDRRGEVAGRLLGAAVSQRRRIKAPLPPADREERAQLEGTIEAELGEATYRRAIRAGARLPLDRARAGYPNLI